MSTSTGSDKKLNIAMIGHKRIPSREGGIEIVVEELARRMVKLGHKVTVYNRGGHHVSGSEYDTSNLKEYEGIRIKKAWTIDKKGLAAVTSAVFGSIAAMFGPYDVVHYHAEGPCIACFLPKLTGKRVVATIHGLDHKRAKWGKLASAIIMQGEKNAVKYADEIIVLSEGVQKYFKDIYNRDTVFIPNGVNRPEIKPAEIITEKWGLKKEDYILYLGRIVPEKGAHYLIEAYNRIIADSSDSIATGDNKNSMKKLVIAGGASDSSEYMDQLKAQAGDNPNIIFTGFIQGQTLEELYSNAYLYILPSDLEGMPLSLLEAMSYGNACLTSDIEECASVMGDCGVTFKVSDVEDLASQLKMSEQDPGKIQELKNKSTDYVCNKFNWDNVVEKTIGLYMNN